MAPHRPGRPSVFVHVGEPKTGTTFLQHVLWANRKELANHGLVVPGSKPIDHWRAAQDLREVPQLANDPVGPNAGMWHRLAREAVHAPKLAVISHELLAAASPAQAARGIGSLQSAEVHVVLTVRDFGSLLPAEWQETVKHRSTRPWDAWLGDVLDTEAGSPERRRFLFWRMHDTLDILRTWGAPLPPDHVHVITVPPRGSAPNLLWRRFAGVLGIDADIADLSRVRRNTSLDAAQVEFLRRLNERLPPSVPDWFYMRNVKDALAHEALPGMPRSSHRLELPPERVEQARRHAAQVVADLRASDYDIVGEPEELMPRAAGEPRRDPVPASLDAGMLDAAYTAITTLLTEIGRTQGVDVAADHVVTSRPAGPIKRRFIELSQRSPTVFRLRRGYWHLANAARHLRSATAPGPGPDSPLP